MEHILYHLSLTYPYLSNFFQHIDQYFNIAFVKSILFLLPKDSPEWKLFTFINNTKQPFHLINDAGYLFLDPETKDNFVVVFSEDCSLGAVQINNCYICFHEDTECTLVNLPPTYYEFDIWRIDRIKDSFITLDEGSIFFKEINTEVFFAKILTKDRILYKIDNQKTKWFEGKTND